MTTILTDIPDPRSAFIAVRWRRCLRGRSLQDLRNMETERTSDGQPLQKEQAEKVS